MSLDGVTGVWGDGSDDDFVPEEFTREDREIFEDVDVLPEHERLQYAQMTMGAIDRRRPQLRVAAQRARGSIVSIPICRWRPRARAHRYRTRRRVARTCGSRGDPPEPEPPGLGVTWF